MLFASVFFAGLALAAAGPQRNTFTDYVDEGFICPDAYGLFMDERQCDKYYKCEEGIATELLCDDGKVFDEFRGKAGHVDPCDSPYVVDCENRTKLQTPKTVSKFCPRLNGIFADESLCDIYYTCIGGLHTVTTCVSGLHFDDKTGTCAWPAVAQRTNCGVEKKCIGDFCCENAENFVDSQGLQIPHPSFPNLEDCQKFYVCLNGRDPQEQSCRLGTVFDDITMKCDYPENVPACHGWYSDHPEFADYYVDDAGPAAKSDVGAEDVAA